mgnify:CR=1 FL=1
MNIVNSYSLRNHNTFHINVNAEFFININSEDQLIDLLDRKNNNKNKFVLGGGSNILLTKDINGLVIHNQIKGLNIVYEDNHQVILQVGAGELWDDVVEWSTERDLYGIENLSLIPGYAGAAPIQNIGAYGSELKYVFEELDAINLHTKEKIKLNKNDCKFGYRDSIFKNKLSNEFIITQIKIKLSKDKNLNIDYKILQDHINKLKKENITSKDIRNQVIKIRTSKLPNPSKIGNAGSFFKNPIIKKNTLLELQKEYPEIPYFAKKEEIKIPAAWLIEKGQWKGYKEKTCGIYAKHALILINNGGATGKEIVNLSNRIKKDIYKKFNVILEEEVSII